MVKNNPNPVVAVDYMYSTYWYCIISSQFESKGFFSYIFFFLIICQKALNCIKYISRYLFFFFIAFAIAKTKKPNHKKAPQEGNIHQLYYVFHRRPTHNISLFLHLKLILHELSFTIDLMRELNKNKNKTVYLW